MSNSEETTRHVPKPRREPRITQPITFDLRSYGELGNIKEALQEQTGVSYSNSVIARVLALAVSESLRDNPELIHRLKHHARHCASRNKKTPARSKT